MPPNGRDIVEYDARDDTYILIIILEVSGGGGAT
jgi:hypothetical protein